MAAAQSSLTSGHKSPMPTLPGPGCAIVDAWPRLALAVDMQLFEKTWEAPSLCHLETCSKFDEFHELQLQQLTIEKTWKMKRR